MGAVVMGTGVVSAALDLDGEATLSGALLAVAIGVLGVLAGQIAYGLICERRRLRIEAC